MSSDDPRIAAFETFCKTLGREYLTDYQFMLSAYEIAERNGLNILPVSYYSPVATAADIDAADCADLFGGDFGVDLDRAVQYRLLVERVIPFGSELIGIPEKNAPQGFSAGRTECFRYRMPSPIMA